MAFQHWFCEFCGEEGTVQHKKHEGAYAVLTQIGVQHRKYFPACADLNGTTRVRCGFPPAGFAAKKREPIVERSASR